MTFPPLEVSIPREGQTATGFRVPNDSRRQMMLLLGHQ